MIKFEVYYDDGMVYEGETQGDFYTAPVTGVLGIIWMHDDGDAKEFVDGCDHYYIEDGRFIVGSDTAPRTPYLFGTEVPDTEWVEFEANVRGRSKFW